MAPPLHIATAWLPDELMVDWLRTFTSRPLAWHLAVPERVHQLIIENFGVGSGSLDDSDETSEVTIGELASEAIDLLADDEDGGGDGGDGSPVPTARRGGAP